MLLVSFSNNGVKRQGALDDFERIFFPFVSSFYWQIPFGHVNDCSEACCHDAILPEIISVRH